MVAANWNRGSHRRAPRVTLQWELDSRKLFMEGLEKSVCLQREMMSSNIWSAELKEEHWLETLVIEMWFEFS